MTPRQSRAMALLLDAMDSGPRVATIRKAMLTRRDPWSVLTETERKRAMALLTRIED